MNIDNTTTSRRVHKVYLAGKIAKGDWRCGIFPHIGAVSIKVTPPLGGNDRPAVEPAFGSEVRIRDRLECCGPFFVSCDHGCFHGRSEHGVGVGSRGCASGFEFPNRGMVPGMCARWVDDADVVFCYIDGERAFGTIFELGYAVAKGKPIFMAVKMDGCLSGHGEELDAIAFWEDAWFLRYSVNRVIGTPDASSAWNFFVKWYWSKYVPSHGQQDAPVTIGSSKNGKPLA
jgi:hypothetical protein